MFALALLLVVEPPPASVRLEITERIAVGNADPTVTTESMEAAIAADGKVFARVADDDRTRTLSAQVKRTGDRWYLAVTHRDSSFGGWYAAPGGRKRIENVTQTANSFSIEAVGKSVKIGGIREESASESGTAERRTRSYTYTLLPAFGAPATHEPAVIQGFNTRLDPAP